MKTVKPISMPSRKYYGWQDLYQQPYPQLGKRWMGKCDIPDLDLFPKYYGIKNIQFSARIESNFYILGYGYCPGWLDIFPKPTWRSCQLLLKVTHLIDLFGSYDGGMHTIISGKDQTGNQKAIKWFMIAKNNEGPFIATVTSVILVKKL